LLFAVDKGAASSGYVLPEVLAAELVHDLGLPVGAPDVDLDVISGLGVARRAFARVATAAGLGVERVAELTVAVNEVTTNALVHGRGAARLRAWITGPGGVACVVDDDGDGPTDPLLGFVPAPSDALGGRGVWLARQLFDRVEWGRTPTGFRMVLATDPV
jgi:anti-sigma regulatory factor (Ser/Thr protein kinase)